MEKLDELGSDILAKDFIDSFLRTDALNEGKDRIILLNVPRILSSLVFDMAHYLAKEKSDLICSKYYSKDVFKKEYKNAIIKRPCLEQPFLITDNPHSINKNSYVIYVREFLLQKLNNTRRLIF